MPFKCVSDSYSKAESKTKESLYKSDIATDNNEEATDAPLGKRQRM